MPNEDLRIVETEPANYEERSPFAGLFRDGVVPGSVRGTMKACELDWIVEKEPMYLKSGRLVPDRMAVLRRPGDVILGTAGKLFTPIQNLEAFMTLQPALDEFGARIETAGSFGDGDRVWMLMSLPQKKGSMVAKGDEIKPYFLVSNAHTSEKSQSLQARFTSIRVCCQNTLEAAQRADRAAVAIPHHKNAGERLEEISEVVKRMYEVHTNSIRVYQELAGVKVTEAEAAEYFSGLFRLRDQNEDARLTKMLSKAGASEYEGRLSKVFKAREHSMWLLHHGKGTGLTAWGAYNAVTEYIDHVSILKQDGGLTKNGFETAAFGYGAAQKRMALDMALERWLGVKRGN